MKASQRKRDDKAWQTRRAHSCGIKRTQSHGATNAGHEPPGGPVRDKQRISVAKQMDAPQQSTQRIRQKARRNTNACSKTRRSHTNMAQAHAACKRMHQHALTHNTPTKKHANQQHTARRSRRRGTRGSGRRRPGGWACARAHDPVCTCCNHDTYFAQTMRAPPAAPSNHGHNAR